MFIRKFAKRIVWDTVHEHGANTAP